MRNWLRKVMTGRYGVDEFNRFLNTTALITLVLSVLFKGVLGMLFWLLAIGALVYSYFRMFSRKTYRRRAKIQPPSGPLPGPISTSKSAAASS